MCQDVEIIGEKSVPRISIENFIEMMTIGTKKTKFKQTKKKKEEELEKDVLAIELYPSSEEKQYLLLEVLKQKQEVKSLRQSLQKMCPMSFAWYLDEMKLP